MRHPHIIFLDLDGPLFSGRALMLPENNGAGSEILRELKLHPLVSYWKADPVAIAMLHSLYELRPFQLVISSSWANEGQHTKEQIQRLLDINDINIVLNKQWKTPKGETCDRAYEISLWLQENKHSDYMILDDFESGDKLMNDTYLRKYKLNKFKVVLVDVEEGITMKDFYKMQATVSNWD